MKNTNLEMDSELLKLETAEKIIDVINVNRLHKTFFHIDDDFSECMVEVFPEMEEFTESGIFTKRLNKLGLRNFSLIDQASNTDELYSVIYFKDEDVYIRIDGVYDSYGQYEHDYYTSIKQVFPKKVEITKYE